MRPVLALLLICFSPMLWAADGLVKVKSAHPPKEAIDRLERIVKEKGMTVFARVDHAAGAAKVGEKLPPTELLIFGNPQGGTPLMQCAHSAAIDLPMKALAWEDGKGQAWLAYNDPAWIAQRHDAPKCAAAGKLKEALGNLVGAAAK